MSAGEIAGLIAAIAFVLLVGLLAVPLLKLGRTLDETTRLVSTLHERTVPLLSDLDTTVKGVNAQLETVDTITTHAESVAGSVSQLTTLFSATLGGPLVRVASISYGLRRALSGRGKKKDGAKRTKHTRSARTSGTKDGS